MQIILKWHARLCLHLFISRSSVPRPPANWISMLMIWLKCEIFSLGHPKKLKTKANAWQLSICNLPDVVLWKFYSSSIPDTWRQGLCTRVYAGCPQGKFIENFKRNHDVWSNKIHEWLHFWPENIDQDPNIAPVMTHYAPSILCYLLETICLKNGQKFKKVDSNNRKARPQDSRNRQKVCAH